MPEKRLHVVTVTLHVMAKDRDTAEGLAMCLLQDGVQGTSNDDRANIEVAYYSTEQR